MVNANMAQLIREMTVNKGKDPREFSLVSFGGAGGQHAYGVASLVGCTEVLFPRHAGAFSALGLVQADLQTSEAQSIIRSLDGLSLSALNEPFEQLEQQARQTFGQVDPADTTVLRQVMMRYDGQTHEVLVDVLATDSAENLYARFEDIHESLYGTRLGDPAEIVSIHMTVSLTQSRLQAADTQVFDHPNAPVVVSERWSALFQESVPVYDGYHLGHEAVIEGPAFVEEGDTVIVVPPDSHLTFDAAEGLYLLALPPDDGPNPSNERY
jgi:N-methylhydantoinase A